jgi:hypothetical protein
MMAISVCLLLAVISHGLQAIFFYATWMFVDVPPEGMFTSGIFNLGSALFGPDTMVFWFIMALFGFCEGAAAGFKGLSVTRACFRIPGLGQGSAEKSNPSGSDD